MLPAASVTFSKVRALVHALYKATIKKTFSEFVLPAVAAVTWKDSASAPSLICQHRMAMLRYTHPLRKKIN